MISPVFRVGDFDNAAVDGASVLIYSIGGNWESAPAKARPNGGIGLVNARAIEGGMSA
jgi:hypothetical protein